MKNTKEKHRLNVALSMDNALQRETWKILSGKENRTNAVCEAVCGYYKRKDFLEQLRKILHDELKNVTVSTSAEPKEAAEPEIGDDVLNFLMSL